MEIPERDQEQSPQEKRNAPTVTKEKWRSHALAKLERGYVLIVGTQRRTANFYQPGKGYEMCAYNVATQLIKEGSVVKAYDHHLGTAYGLAAGAKTPPPAPKPPAPKPPKPRDEMDALLDELIEDEGDEEASDDEL